VGKTTLAHALARCIDASFRRIQFTSDCPSADLIDSALPRDARGLSTGGFRFQPGPLFATRGARGRDQSREPEGAIGAARGSIGKGSWILAASEKYRSVK